LHYLKLPLEAATGCRLFIIIFTLPAQASQWAARANTCHVVAGFASAVLATEVHFLLFACAGLGPTAELNAMEQRVAHTVSCYCRLKL
jgi:hypothetical protein